MKLLLTSILLIVPFVLFSQEIERIEISGIVSAPEGEEVEEISVYNISSQKGTVTNAKGEFTIAVAVNDKVQITSLQFKDATLVITQEDIDLGRLDVFFNPMLNQLEPVLLRTVDLSGIVDIDSKNIETSTYDPQWDLSYEALNYGYNWERDASSKIDENVADAALNLTGNSAPRVASVDVAYLVKLFLPKREKKKKNPSVVQINKEIAVDALLKKYDENYIAETFGIPNDKVTDFVYFVQKNGLKPEWLNTENEVELIQYLFDQSALYKKLLATKK